MRRIKLPPMPRYSVVLRPGAVFAGFDWCMTPLYDGGNSEHRELKEGIEYGSALPEIASFTEITDSLRAAGFELVEARDRAPDADPRDAVVSTAGRQ